MEQPARPRQQAITSGEVEDDYIQVVIKKKQKKTSTDLKQPGNEN